MQIQTQQTTAMFLVLIPLITFQTHSSISHQNNYKEYSFMSNCNVTIFNNSNTHVFTKVQVYLCTTKVRQI